jgi:hypothetical protein
LNALASTGQLDLLQLDYDSPQARSCSPTFFEQFRRLHKHLFLEPSLRLVTNAGASAVVACVEALGAYLREHGDAAMPITAVRGDNLLPRLAELAASGLELADESTGKPLRDIKLPLLTAQVELGAGPLVAAWEEGSRIVVAGCYDLAAPFIAAANSSCSIVWDDYDAWARLAVASRATSLSPKIAELVEPSQLTLAPLRSRRVDPENLAEQIQELAAPGQMLRHADVDCDVASLAFCPAEFGRFAIDGVAGRAPVGTWRVRLTYLTDDVVESRRQTIVRWTRVPRDAVHVSVDTRPAAQWF